MRAGAPERVKASDSTGGFAISLQTDLARGARPYLRKQTATAFPDAIE